MKPIFLKVGILPLARQQMTALEFSDSDHLSVVHRLRFHHRFASPLSPQVPSIRAFSFPRRFDDRLEKLSVIYNHLPLSDLTLSGIDVLTVVAIFRGQLPKSVNDPVFLERLEIAAETFNRMLAHSEQV